MDETFRFAEDSFPGNVGGWNSQLRAATGVTDGEHYLLRLFKKTGTPLDDDLRSLVARSLRRIRRVLSSRHARDILVEVLDVAEDETEIVQANSVARVDGEWPPSRAAELLDREFATDIWRARIDFCCSIIRIADYIPSAHAD